MKDNSNSIKNMPTVSVIVVTYHTGEILFPVLESVLAYEGLDLIVVDNGNPDQVLDRLEGLAQQSGRVTLLSGHGNVGFAKGCNLGASIAKAEVLLFLNPDGIIGPEGIGLLLKEAESLEGPWLIGGRLLEATGAEQAGSRRGELTPLNALGESLKVRRFLPRASSALKFNLHTEPLPTDTVEVPTISGACMMVSLKDYNSIGGMDEGYFLHVEDIDFCHRFRQAGGRVYFCPKVSILHQKSTSDAPKLFVEWHKARGFWRYFGTHFKGEYPPGFIALVNLGVFCRFSAIAVKSLISDWLGSFQRSSNCG